MAQATRNVTATKFGYVEKASPSTVVDITLESYVQLDRKNDKTIINYLYVGFNSWPSSLKNNRIYSVTATFCAETYESIYPKIGLYISTEDFDPSTLVWTNRPAKYGDYWLITDGNGLTSKANGTMSLTGDVVDDQQRSAFASGLLSKKTAYLFCSTYGAGTYGPPSYIKRDPTSLWVYKKLVNGSSNPYITVTYDDSVYVKSKITPNNSPTDGYVNPRTDTKFQWTFERDETETYYCAGGFTQRSAALYWKTAEEESWHTVSASGSTQSLTVPGSAEDPTFPPGSEIQWYLQGTDTNGTPSTSDTFTFSTAATPVEVSLITPVATMEDGSTDIVLRWNYSTTDGFAPSKVSLQWRRTDAAEWTSLLTEALWATSYTIPPNTLPAAEIEWRVLGYNIDGVAGEYATAIFVSVAAPIVLSITATEVPFSTIRWQVEAQTAYQVAADDTEYGPFYGAEKDFTLPDPLSDGAHTVRVRAMGGYGLWSEWLETGITITNEAEMEIVLSADSGLDVILNWTPEGTGNYTVYRDGNPIGSTTGNAFVDRLASGTHEYSVLQALENGFYTRSNPVTAAATFDGAYIAPMSGGDWIPLRLSETEDRGPSYDDSLRTTYNHMAGAVYPSVTISDFRQSVMSYSVAFPDRDEETHRSFRALFGTPVVLKLPDGTLFVGVLDAWSRKSRVGFYTSYTFNIRRIEWEGFVHDDT